MTYIPGDEHSVDLDERLGNYDGGSWVGGDDGGGHVWEGDIDEQAARDDQFREAEEQHDLSEPGR